MVFDTTILGSNPSAPATLMNNIFSNINFVKKKIKNFFSPFYKSYEVKKIFNILEKNSPSKEKTAMIVGGAVRNFLKGEKVGDIDIATIFSPEEIKEKFINSGIKVIETGIEHGTLTLLVNEKTFEITTLRKDITTDGRHAEIAFTDNWHEDSKRRDFTINAIYLDRRGKLFDPQSGIKDLEKNIVKFIENPNTRIKEDYLRIIRFIRFSLQYNSELDFRTFQAIKLNLSGVKNLSKERVFSELIKILSLKNLQNLEQNNDLKNVFSLVFPELRYFSRIKKIKFLNNKNSLSQDLILSALIIDDTNNHEYFCHKYKTSNKTKENINLFSSLIKDFKSDNSFFKNNLKKNLYFFGKEMLRELNDLLFVVISKRSHKDYLAAQKKILETPIPKFPYDGQYLITRGFKEGRIIGQVLKKLEKQWINLDFSLSDQQLIGIIEKEKD